MEESQDNPLWNKRYQFRFSKDDHELISYLESLDTTNEKGLHTTVLKHLAFLGYRLAKEQGLLKKKYALSNHVNQLRRGEITILQSSSSEDTDTAEHMNNNSNNPTILEMQRMLMAQNEKLLQENEQLRKQQDASTPVAQSNKNDEKIISQLEELIKQQFQTYTNTTDILDKIDNLKFDDIKTLVVEHKEDATLNTASEVVEQKEIKKNNAKDEFIIIEEEDDNKNGSKSSSNASKFVANLPFDINAIASSMSKLEG